MVKRQKAGASAVRTASHTATNGREMPCEEVARVAYELFVSRGCVHGNDQDDWFEAERIVRSRAARAPGRGASRG